ncbi:Zinc finger protein glis2 [Homalodisca vitripennis]|nr:Zinc finger protein glis2 [Homalodisca vitripennis]
MTSIDVSMLDMESCGTSESLSSPVIDQDIDADHVTSSDFYPAVKCRWIRCGEWFSSLHDLASHVSHTHAVAGCEGLFYCGWEGCSRTHRGFNARYKMLVHVRTHTNEKPHQCSQCNKSFSRAENLKIHARSHTGEKPYTCPVPGCHKAYSNSSDRFKHTRTHSIEKPYVCKVAGCNKRYTDPSSLRKHAKTYSHFLTPQQPHLEHNLQENEDIRSRIIPTSADHEERLHIEYVTTHFSASWLQSLYPTNVLSWGKMDEQEAPLDLTVHHSTYH